LRTLRLKKREFNRKDAEKCKVRKVQFHAVYSIHPFPHSTIISRPVGERVKTQSCRQNT